MGVELVNKDMPKEIWAGDMKDGDIAVVLASNGYNNRIVQRHKNMLISVGRTDYWGDVRVLSKAFRVRVLEKGETLVIT